ncbi:MAG: hypothetical protein WBQ60_07740 [Asticcacaulis sp.]
MSRLSKIFVSSAAALALLSAPVSGSAAPAPVTANGITTQNASASDAFPGLKGFLNLPASARNQLSVYYVLRVKHADPAAVKITMSYKGQTTPIRLGSDGRLTPLPTRDQLNGGATVSISGPESAGVGMKLHVYSPQPDSTTYDAQALATGVQQGNAAMSKIAGPLALMLPKLDRVYMVGGGDGVAEWANGQKKPLPKTASKGEYPAGTPYFVPSDMKGAVRLTFSHKVTLAHYDTK